MAMNGGSNPYHRMGKAPAAPAAPQLEGRGALSAKEASLADHLEKRFHDSVSSYVTKAGYPTLKCGPKFTRKVRSILEQTVEKLRGEFVPLEKLEKDVEQAGENAGKNLVAKDRLYDPAERAPRIVIPKPPPTPVSDLRELTTETPPSEMLRAFLKRAQDYDALTQAEQDAALVMRGEIIGKVMDETRDVSLSRKQLVQIRDNADNLGSFALLFPPGHEQRASQVELYAEVIKRAVVGDVQPGQSTAQ